MILDKPKTKGMNLSTEDVILCKIFEEKACTVADLVIPTSKVSYAEVKRTIASMIMKGYIYSREMDNRSHYYLTAAGVYEFEYRINTTSYSDCHFLLMDMGYDRENVSRFLKKAFYNYYLTGEWDESRLESRYLDWCEANEIDPRNHNVKLNLIK